MMQCPHCQSTLFNVYRTITIEQHCHVRFSAPGELHIVADTLGDTRSTGEVENIDCAGCDSSMNLQTFGYPENHHAQTLNKGHDS